MYSGREQASTVGPHVVPGAKGLPPADSLLSCHSPGKVLSEVFHAVVLFGVDMMITETNRRHLSHDSCILGLL